MGEGGVGGPEQSPKSHGVPRPTRSLFRRYPEKRVGGSPTLFPKKPLFL